ncbi:MAG: hypothetical protein QXS85_01605 [Acidilobaceae archaeon]
MRRVRVVLAGFGTVGRALVKTIAVKREEIARRHGVLVEVTGVADSRGCIVKSEGFTPYELMKASELPRSSLKDFEPYGRGGWGLEELLEEARPDIHVEVTPSNYETGEPGLSHIRLALSRGVHVVTANKAPLALAFEELASTARQRGLSIRFGATVMGGSPFIAMLSSMRSRDVIRVEGVLNATTNYVLTLMQEELVEFEKALREAQAIGVAEPDPSLDIRGVDAAAKLVIVSHLIGRPLRLEDIEREPLDSVTLKDVVAAAKQGFVLKYVAELDAKRSLGRVSLKRLQRESFLANVRGLDNGVVVETDVGPVVLIGRGGGALETAHTLLDDILSIALEGG